MKQKRIARSPTLESVIMVEKTIRKYSQEYGKYQLWKKLPKKMMWGTFNVILEYLWNSNKIGMDRTGYIIYTWNPELIERLKNRRMF